METNGPDILADAYAMPYDWRENGAAPKDKYSLMKLVDRCRTEGEAYELLEEMRWGTDGPYACPHCGSVKGSYFLTPKDGTSRATRTGNKSERRVWKCKDCRKQFSVLTNTPFHGMRISVRKLVFVVFELCSSKNGVSAREIERKYDLTPKSAWFLLMRIREGMGQDDPFWTNADISIDETYVGGKVNRMNQKRKRKLEKDFPGQKFVAGGVAKTPVVTLINRTTGQAYSQVVNDVNRDNVRAVIDSAVDVPNVDLHTDGSPLYKIVGREARTHTTVDHKRGEYTKGKSSGTNPAESYFAQFKRSIDGTHHHVSSVHLGMYLKEFDFRHNTHKLPDSVRMGIFWRNLNGKRITYKPSLQH